MFTFLSRKLRWLTDAITRRGAVRSSRSLFSSRSMPVRYWTYHSFTSRTRRYGGDYGECLLGGYRHLQTVQRERIVTMYVSFTTCYHLLFTGCVVVWCAYRSDSVTALRGSVWVDTLDSPISHSVQLHTELVWVVEVWSQFLG